MGARARCASRDDLAREPDRADEDGRARAGSARAGSARLVPVGSGAGRRRRGQPAHGPCVPKGDLHHRMGGRRVRADRGRQLAARPARRRPDHLRRAPSRPAGQAGPGRLRGAGRDTARALRAAVTGEEAATLAEYARHPAGQRPAGPARGGRRRSAAPPPGAPRGAGTPARHVRWFPARPFGSGRAAGQRRRGHCARPGGDLRTGRARSTRLRHAGGGERGVRAARGGGRGRGQRGRRGPGRRSDHRAVLA